jgi:hypothetical protein
VVLFLYGIAAAGGVPPAWSLVDYQGSVPVSSWARCCTSAFWVFLCDIFSPSPASDSCYWPRGSPQSAGFLLQAGLLPSLGEQIWDSSWLIDEVPLPVSFCTPWWVCARPAGMQVLVYADNSCRRRFDVHGWPSPARFQNARTFRRRPCRHHRTLRRCGTGPADAAPFSVFAHGGQGENEIEYRGFHDFDDDSSRDGKEKHKVGVGAASPISGSARSTAVTRRNRAAPTSMKRSNGRTVSS